jgi:hypothetical protein
MPVAALLQVLWLTPPSAAFAVAALVVAADGDRHQPSYTACVGWLPLYHLQSCNHKCVPLAMLLCSQLQLLFHARQATRLLRLLLLFLLLDRPASPIPPAFLPPAGLLPSPNGACPAGTM